MDWAAPDVSTPAAPPSPPPGSVAPSRRPPVPVTRRLGPMTIPDILDGAFALLRRAPATVLGLTAIFVIPTQLLGAFVARNVSGSEIFDALGAGDTSLLANQQISGADTSLMILSSLAPSIALVFVASGMMRLVSAWQTGGDVALGELLRGSMRFAWPLLASWALVKVAEGIGFMFCFLPALAAMTWFLVTVPAITAEELGPIEGMRRSARLASRRFWPVLAIGVLSWVVTLFFTWAVQAIPLLVIWVTGVDQFNWVITGLTGAVTALLTTPVVAGATVLTYLDLRVRTEGLDLELDAMNAFPTPA